MDVNPDIKKQACKRAALRFRGCWKRPLPTGLAKTAFEALDTVDQADPVDLVETEYNWDLVVAKQQDTRDVSDLWSLAVTTQDGAEHLAEAPEDNAAEVKKAKAKGRSPNEDQDDGHVSASESEGADDPDDQEDDAEDGSDDESETEEEEEPKSADLEAIQLVDDADDADDAKADPIDIPTILEETTEELNVSSVPRMPPNKRKQADEQDCPRQCKTQRVTRERLTPSSPVPNPPHPTKSRKRSDPPDLPEPQTMAAVQETPSTSSTTVVAAEPGQAVNTVVAAEPGQAANTVVAAEPDQPSKRRRTTRKKKAPKPPRRKANERDMAATLDRYAARIRALDDADFDELKNCYLTDFNVGPPIRSWNVAYKKAKSEARKADRSRTAEIRHRPITRREVQALIHALPPIPVNNPPFVHNTQIVKDEATRRGVVVKGIVDANRTKEGLFKVPLPNGEKRQEEGGDQITVYCGDAKQKMTRTKWSLLDEDLVYKSEEQLRLEAEVKEKAKADRAAKAALKKQQAAAAEADSAAATATETA